MDLKTLKGYSPDQFITIDHETNTISFKLQQGPVKVNGINGCQVDDVIVVTARIIAALNEKKPSKFNDVAITNLAQALVALEIRAKDRTDRGEDAIAKARDDLEDRGVITPPRALRREDLELLKTEEDP